MNRDEILTNARFSGQVLRYHTWPVHRQQSVGEHTWQLMRIYWQIWGKMHRDVSEYILWHDAGELVLGDLPFPVKKQNFHLKQECDKVERLAIKNMGGPDNLLPTLDQSLMPCDLQRVKLCDIIEMFEYGKTEWCMGNQYANPIILDTKAEIIRLMEEFDGIDRQLILTYLGKDFL